MVTAYKKGYRYHSSSGLKWNIKRTYNIVLQDNVVVDWIMMG